MASRIILLTAILLATNISHASAAEERGIIKTIKPIIKLISQLSQLSQQSQTSLLPGLYQFAKARLTEVLGTTTGVLAAVGGGYLLYVATVALYGNVLGEPYHLSIHRSSEHFFDRIASIEYPEVLFDWLQVREDSCKMKTICEIQAFLSKTGVPSIVLEDVSRKIPGMQKYSKASYRGINKQSCYNNCPTTLSQMFMKAVGLK